MKRIRQRIRDRATAIARHRFYEWLEDDGVPLEDRFRFAPLFVTYIMAFSDMNRWFMRYPAPATDLERAINEHTREDETHSRLFLDDWNKLGLDRQLGWTPNRTIEWYFASEETEVFRDYGMEINQMCVLHPDARDRAAFMEAIETCGHVFFGVTARVATRLTARTGQEYRYFGPFHLQRETGHLQADSSSFDAVRLSEEQAAGCLRLVDRIFDMFEVENDHLLSYARREAAPVTQRTSRRPQATATSTPVRAASRLAQGELEVLLERRKQTTASHPLFQWLLEDHSLSSSTLLRCVALLWAPDIMGYKDLNEYALTYRDPTGPRERAINRWTARLKSHHRLFLADWASLDMDAWLGWSASETLRFYCLSERTEIQRKNMATFVRLAYGHADPALRFWLIEALEATGEPFFAATRQLAERFESEAGRRLDYLAGRHDSSHPALAVDEEADSVSFRADHLSARDLAAARNIIDTVFDKIDEQYSLSLKWIPSGDSLPSRKPPAP